MYRKAVLLILLLLAGCYSWQTKPGSTEAVFRPEHPPKRVRLQLVGGKKVVLWYPRIENDSINGHDRGGEGYKTRTVALADVTKVEVHSFDGGRTGFVVVGLLAAGTIAWAIDVEANGGLDGWGGSWSSDGGSASCPQVYSWDGVRWRLDSGTFGGAFAEALERTDYDNLDYPVAENGQVHLRVANELDETEYIDALQLLEVDHPADRIVVPLTNGVTLSLRPPASPVAAMDDAGRDALRQVRDADGWSWESTLRQRNPDAPREIRDGVVVSFVRPAGAHRGTLVLDGHTTVWASLMLREFVAAHGHTTRDWYAGLKQSPEQARGMAAALAREGFLSAAVQTGQSWKPAGLFWEAGPEVVKRQALPLDLSGVEGDTVRVRLESIPSFWLVDRVSMSWGPPDTVTPRELPLLSAIDRQEQDQAPELRTVDHRRFTLETDEWADLVYRDDPPAAEGHRRSYLLRSTGWYRIHTAEAGAPDSALLAEVASGPGGGSRVAVRKSNEALRWLTDRPARGGR
jgi:hypothetical protein